MRISNEDFERAWNESGSAADAAIRTRYAVKGIYVKVARLRSLGFKLKEMRQARSTDAVHANAERSESNVQRFIAAWNASESPDDAATKLGVARDYAIVRASNLRGRGHDLKKFNAGRVRAAGERPDYFRSQKQDFADLWNASESIDEVAEKLGVDKATVTGRASDLRRQDFDLKIFGNYSGPKAGTEEAKAVSREQEDPQPESTAAWRAGSKEGEVVVRGTETWTWDEVAEIFDFLYPMEFRDFKGKDWRKIPVRLRWMIALHSVEDWRELIAAENTRPATAGEDEVAA